MGKHRISRLAICPFYLHENRSVVYCEGVVDDSVVHVAFASPTAAHEYKKEYCQKNYKDCLICQMLDRKEQEE